MQHFGLLLRLIYKRISLFTQHKQNKGRVFRDERPCFLFFHYKKLLHLHKISKLHFMNTLQRLYILLLTFSMCYGCRPDAEGIWQTERNNVTDVTDRIQIVCAAQYDVAMTGTLVPYVIGPYVMITDHNMINGAIHVFRIGDMRYLTSFGKPGGYSGEIAALGHVAWDDVHKEILVADLGHLMIYGFPLDSILQHPDAAPIVRSKLQKSSYPQFFTRGRKLPIEGRHYIFHRQKPLLKLRNSMSIVIMVQIIFIPLCYFIIPFYELLIFLKTFLFAKHHQIVTHILIRLRPLIIVFFC